MKTSSSPSAQNKRNVDWARVVEIVISILTFGLSHIRKHHKSQPQN